MHNMHTQNVDYTMVQVYYSTRAGKVYTIPYTFIRRLINFTATYMIYPFSHLQYYSSKFELQIRILCI